jgi:hypothetical protein
MDKGLAGETRFLTLALGEAKKRASGYKKAYKEKSFGVCCLRRGASRHRTPNVSHLSH